MVTSTFVLRGRRGTYGTAWRAWTVWSPVPPRDFAWQAWHLVTGHIHLRFAWQAWHLWHWAGSGGALGPVLVAGDAAALCVAVVALGDIHLRFARHAWHLVTSTFVLRGRRSTFGTGLALVARLGRFWSPVTPRHFAWHAWNLVTGHIHLRFAWQAWHLVTSTFVSRGRRGPWSHPPSSCVAGVALMALMALGWLWWRAWAGFGLR